MFIFFTLLRGFNLHSIVIDKITLMPSLSSTLPIVRRLPDDFSISQWFPTVSTFPGCLWFDSASSQQIDDAHECPSSRYSFLMFDPVQTLVANLGDANPWPTIEQWCRKLIPRQAEGLPPMQGGIAGLIGYEAAGWLESVNVSPRNQSPTPAVCVGLYDWTIATDHREKVSWLISQGFPTSDNESNSFRDCYTRAIKRADQVQRWIDDSRDATKTPSPNSSDDRLGKERVASNFTSEQFRSAVAEVVHRIRRGDFFQANLAQQLSVPATISPTELYLRLRQTNPAPYGVFYHHETFDVLSSSPEAFLRVAGRKVETRPIKGTVPRTGDEAVDQQLADFLQNSVKDRAENTMIVDLMRNDLSRVCTDDSVQVRKLCQLERYQYVQHLVSIVEGELREDQNVVDLLQACFPGGSVTGAPKIEAMQTIAELEPDRRGPYCGSMGYISCSGHAEFNILIRTLTATAPACEQSREARQHGTPTSRTWQIPVGGGITARSDPPAEEAETWAKAEGMLRAFSGLIDSEACEGSRRLPNNQDS